MIRYALACCAGLCAALLFLGAASEGVAGSTPKASRFLFLPARQNLWVVDRHKGSIVFFTFPDNEERPVQRSRTFAVDRTAFPPHATKYLLSQRNITSFLWIVNEQSGEVQVLRYRRDGTFDSDWRLPVAREFD